MVQTGCSRLTLCSCLGLSVWSARRLSQLRLIQFPWDMIEKPSNIKVLNTAGPGSKPCYTLDIGPRQREYSDWSAWRKREYVYMTCRVNSPLACLAYLQFSCPLGYTGRVVFLTSPCSCCIEHCHAHQLMLCLPLIESKLFFQFLFTCFQGLGMFCKAIQKKSSFYFGTLGHGNMHHQTELQVELVTGLWGIFLCHQDEPSTLLSG